MNPTIQQPDRIILGFLTLIADFLKKKDDFDMETLCSQMENCCIDARTTPTVLSNTELKLLLFSKKDLVPCLEISVKALMDFLLYEIQNEDMKYYKKILINIATPLCTIVEVLDKNVDSKPIRKSVLEVVGVLVQLLGDGKAPSIKDKPSLQLFVTRILGVFEKIGFARKRIMRELCAKLKNFQILMMELLQQNSTTNVFYTVPHYENIMLNLSLLKEMLQYDLQQSEIEQEKPDNNDESTVVNIRDTLKQLMQHQFPGHIQLLLQECLNLVS